MRPHISLHALRDANITVVSAIWTSFDSSLGRKDRKCGPSRTDGVGPATLPRYAREGAYPVSDTYPIRIRIGYAVDTYPWTIGKKKTKFRYVEDTYPIQQTSNLDCGYAQPRTEWRPCNTKGSRRRVLCGQGCSPARVLASAAEPPSIQAPPPPIEAPRTSAFADWSSTTAGFDLRRRRFDVRNRRIDLCCRRFELRGCRIDAPTL